MADKQNISLQLDAHRVSLSIAPEQEPFYREGAKMLNTRYAYYKRVLPQASAEQLWMYVALEVAVSLHSDAREKDIQPIDDRIRTLNSMIEEVLHATVKDNEQP